LLIQCDFDGTITEEDISFALLDVFAHGDWRLWLEQYRQNKISVGEFNTRAFAMVTAPKSELLAVALRQVKLRPGLPELADYCRARGFRFVVVSNGLDFYIKSILKEAGLRGVEVYAATTRFYRRGVKVQYIAPDGTPLASNFKEAYAREFLKQGYRLTYVGNGPSDIFPAVHAHHIFATEGLLDYCREMDLRCLPFKDLNDVVAGLEQL
jgi:2-hydroxy-3-keto-5-methylthiopentenyl-1-phosphate phosphatase